MNSRELVREAKNGCPIVLLKFGAPSSERVTHKPRYKGDRKPWLGRHGLRYRVSEVRDVADVPGDN